MELHCIIRMCEQRRKWSSGAGVGPRIAGREDDRTRRKEPSSRSNGGIPEVAVGVVAKRMVEVERSIVTSSPVSHNMSVSFHSSSADEVLKVSAGAPMTTSQHTPQSMKQVCRA